MFALWDDAQPSLGGARLHILVLALFSLLSASNNAIVYKTDRANRNSGCLSPLFTLCFTPATEVFKTFTLIFQFQVNALSSPSQDPTQFPSGQIGYYLSDRS